MGLVFVGFIPALQREARFTPRLVSTRRWALRCSGAVFALGWTPCLGPTLTAVIAVASATEGRPWCAASCSSSRTASGWESRSCCWPSGPRGRFRAWAGCAATPAAIQIFGGVLLIVVGVALVTGLWADFISWVRDAFVSDVRLPI